LPIVRLARDGKVTKIAEGFGAPFGVAVDARGTVYVADQRDHSVYRVDEDGKKSKLAGCGKPERKDGRGEEAGFFCPSGLVLDGQGNLYVKESGRSENSAWMHIRKITKDGSVSTLAKIRRSAE
jgi:sugar lactone lactonase YvrE